MESISNNRVQNNTMRHQYRVLTAEEKDTMQSIKDAGLVFSEILDKLDNTPESKIAKIRIQEAVMWAVKSVTQ